LAANNPLTQALHLDHEARKIDAENGNKSKIFVNVDNTEVCISKLMAGPLDLRNGNLQSKAETC
jgi:hypothetical protein